MIKVEKAWQKYDWYKFREVNHVQYDPAKVSVTQLEDWLKKVHTYQKTLEPSGNQQQKE